MILPNKILEDNILMIWGHSVSTVIYNEAPLKRLILREDLILSGLNIEWS